MADATFFDAPTEASIKKQRIVSKYVAGWANIVLPNARRREGRIMYVDLFCGPGKYKDGRRSTPLLVLEHAIKTPALHGTLQIIFNDEDVEFTRTLETYIAHTPGIENLHYRPIVWNKIISREIIPVISKMKVPTLFFADPWGYQGVSFDLIEASLAHWGSDFLFFFNYNRVNMNLGCDTMNEPINEFFSAARAQQLREAIKVLRPAQREEAILKAMQNAIKGLGAKFGKFTYRSKTGARPTHHLVCVSKHRQGMALFKEISAKESTRFDDDVPSLEHNPGSIPSQGLLFSPLGRLETDLITKYAGQTVTLDQIYHEDHNGKAYVFKNYRQAVLHLEQVGTIHVVPPRAARSRPESLPGGARITFSRVG